MEIASDAEFVDEDDEGWADGARALREAYTRALRLTPENLEATVGLAVLIGAELRFHMVNRVDAAWCEEEPPGVQIAADDATGRLLVDETVSAARRVLSLDPSNNVAAFLEGLAHECGGAREQALRAYRQALELDPWDEVALARAQELDEDYDPARHEGPEPNPHSRHFWLLRISTPISNSGDEQVVYWRLSDPAGVREAIESELPVIESRNPELEPTHDGLDLLTYVPGRPVVTFDVHDALRRSPSGGIEVDWTAVELDEPLPAVRLPLGQPVRINGCTYFHGRREPVEE